MAEQIHIRNHSQLRAYVPTTRPARPPSFLEKLHGWLLLMLLPFTVLWIPVLASPGLGTVTVLDGLLIMLWGTTLLLYLSRPRFTRIESRALSIVLCAFAPAIFGCVGALIFDSQSPLLGDIMRHAKRFGFPSIIPMAMLISHNKLTSRIRVMAVASLVIMVMAPFTPLARLLPINTQSTDQSGAARDPRATGSLSNPNEFAYVAVLAALIGLSHAAGQRGDRRVRRWWATVAVLAGLMGIVISASRSAMLSVLVAVAYILSQSKLSYMKRFGVITVLIGTALVGWQVSAVYQQRMAAALNERSQDANFAGRVQAQATAFQTWRDHPLGVGFVNITTAVQSGYNFQGGDSIYFDFLLASGIFGFLSIILCFRNCWSLAGSRRSSTEASYLKAGILAAFVFGLASVSPSSVFVAPFFFSVVGLAACLGKDQTFQTARLA